LMFAAIRSAEHGGQSVAITDILAEATA
jgi:hypothetical protein